MKARCGAAALRYQSGLTLIEVLVAVVVLSIGLLGLAGLQVAGLHSSHSAYLRSQATLLANDMADRMRANRAGFEAGDYDNATGQQKANCRDKSTGCGTADMAANDTWEWQQTLSVQLPEGQGVVCVDSTPDDGDDASDPDCDSSGDFYAIKIWWQDERGGNLQRFATSLDP